MEGFSALFEDHSPSSFHRLVSQLCSYYPTWRLGDLLAHSIEKHEKGENVESKQTILTITDSLLTTIDNLIASSEIVNFASDFP